MTTKAKYTTLAALALIAAAAIAYYFYTAQAAPSALSYDTAEVQEAPLAATITATGTIEPVTTVEVGTQVSGIVTRLYVDYNSVVKKGQVIAELDKTNLATTLRGAQADLASAQSKLSYQATNYQRYKTLHEKGLVSDNDFDQARLAYQQAQEAVKVQRERVATAQTNFGYATITSPIDGVVLSKSVEQGQTVAASFNTPTLFTIAQDLTDMRVIANVDEADIGNVAVGQRATFTVDAFPNDVFEGKVTAVRINGTTSNNVVTYEVVISAPNPDLKLKPSLTANVTIFTIERDRVLSVPTKALRFTPTPETISPEDQIVDTQGQHKVWVRTGHTFKAHAVTLGDTDGTRTEILSGIARGAHVITDIKREASSAEVPTQTSSPFAPKRPSRANNAK